ncbi:MAG: homoserine O-acetyltransferase [Gammaproteobacteria bacterium]
MIKFNKKLGYHCFTQPSDFSFVLGGQINPLIQVFETYGTLSSNADNAILIHHALSTNSHIKAHDHNKATGWWENMVGPGKPLDTNKYFIICINNLGSCFGSSGPASINPATHQAYRADFPTVTIDDMVHAQYLVLNALGIKRLHAIMGNSMGAMLTLRWLIDYPDSVNYAVMTSSCYKPYPANIANRVVQREIIQLDPDWQNGYYTTNPQRGLITARKLGHFTYRNPQSLNDKFLNDQKQLPTHQCEIENYLTYNAQKFASQFDTNSYLYLMMAMDLFDIHRGYADLASAIQRIKAKTLIISVDSDILFLPQQQKEMHQLLTQHNVDSQFITLNSPYGHDTFLVETDRIGKYMVDFIT